MKSRILSRRGFFKGIAIVEGSSLLGVEPPLLDGLDSAGALNERETDGHEFKVSPTNLESETDPLPGYRLRLLIPSDASSYQLSIREKTADCGRGLFSDETGVIFEGHAVECPVTSK